MTDDRGPRTETEAGNRQPPFFFVYVLSLGRYLCLESFAWSLKTRSLQYP